MAGRYFTTVDENSIGWANVIGAALFLLWRNGLL